MTKEEKKQLIKQIIATDDLDLMRRTIDGIDFSNINIDSSDIHRIITNTTIRGHTSLLKKVGEDRLKEFVQAYDDLDKWTSFIIDEEHPLSEELTEDDCVEVGDINRTIKGHINAYSYILNKSVDDEKASAIASVKNTTICNIEEMLRHVHETIFEGLPSHSPGEMRSRYNVVMTGGHFDTPQDDRFEETRRKPLTNIRGILRDKDKHKNSENIERAVKTIFRMYTIQLFRDGNSRTSEVVLNFLLSRANIPPSFIGANGLKEEFDIARDVVGYDQRMRHAQLAGDYYIRDKEGRLIVNTKKTDKDGNYFYDKFGKAKKIFVYKDTGEVFEDRSIGKKGDWYNVEFLVEPLFVPDKDAEELIAKQRESQGWQKLRSVDYRPIIKVFYKSILSTYSKIYLEDDKQIEASKPKR